ncbi:hypothetical protein V1498_06595 [Peribacillus sp. SCS-26]|uniref:hypothetical protein n=1 Tax=Paraperibacillus marinus TaxID=3115295 RepID=UPI0039064E24
MKRLYVSGILMLCTCLAFYFFHAGRNIETIIFFPIDKKAVFERAETRLSPRRSGNIYKLIWEATSLTDTPHYLRQDVSLLFRNGRLSGIMKNWKEDTQSLQQAETIKVNQSSLLQAVTFHYGEIHRGEIITSVQQMSSGAVYLILSRLTGPDYFGSPITAVQQEWKQALDSKARAVQESSWNRAMGRLFINPVKYRKLPLTELPIGRAGFFAGIPPSIQEKIIGRLWEGIYKNYALGIKKQDGSITEPLGSTVPLLLLNTGMRELLFITETADGEPVLLKQQY